jgi:hypothetical protein
MSRSIRYVLAVSLVSLLTACGGGGGGDSSTTSTLQDPSTFPASTTLPTGSVTPVAVPDTYAFKQLGPASSLTQAH